MSFPSQNSSKDFQDTLTLKREKKAKIYTFLWLDPPESQCLYWLTENIGAFPKYVILIFVNVNECFQK